MPIELQSIATLILIAWAVLYVAWRAGRIFFRKSGGGGCGGCAKCPVESETPTNLISVESLLAASKRQR